MIGAYGNSCCCTESPDLCDAWPLCTGVECDSNVPLVIPGYTSIGYPLGPTLYDGPFWVAWHNSVVSRRHAVLDIRLKITAIKRTIVQQNCGAGTCDNPLDTPKETLDCLGTGSTPDAGCQITEYVDSFEWLLDGRIAFIGGNKDQDVCGFSSGGENYPGVPKGPYPYILTDCARSGSTPNNPVAVTANNVDWWPGENRRIYPRFAGTMNIVASAIPSDQYPHAASCGTYLLVDRCHSGTTTTAQNVCIDAPITIVPGHTTAVIGDIALCGDGTHPCHLGPGGTRLSCDQQYPENGAEEAAWALDVKEQKLLDMFTAFGLTANQCVGDVDTTWIARTSHDRIRILFGMSNRLTADDVMKFTDNVTISETHEVSKASPGTSLVVKMELEFTPQGWCRYNTRCGCVHSFPENAPSSINVDIYTTDLTNCSNQILDMSYSLGIGEYEIPYGAFTAVCGAEARPNCMQYPVATPGNFAAAPCGALFPPTSPGIRLDYVGSHPVERAHAGWVKYRNRYDHYYCINAVNPAYATFCCNATVPLGGINYDQVEAQCGTEMSAAFIAANQPCPGAIGTCANNVTSIPPTTKCRPVQYVSGAISYSAVDTPSTCHTCQTSYFQCGPMIFKTCGEVLYDVCDCCNTQVTMYAHEIVIVDWDPNTSCTPIGTHTVYGTTSGVECIRQNWTDIGYAVVS